MRNGDFGIEVVASGGGRIRELDSGQVLARPGQVYRLRLRNFGPLYCVADADVDGHRVTAGGLVLAPWSSTELEHPLDATDGGCFTVVAEGDESVFGADGGRDDESLGLIEARFRRELPRRDGRAEVPPVISSPAPLPPRPIPGVPALPPLPPRFPAAPPEWVPPLNRARAPRDVPPATAAYRTATPGFVRDTHDGGDIERAAGTGLTGHSDQQFEPISLGPLEAEATVIQLRIVIGTEAAIADETPRPLVHDHTPARPAARP